MLWASFYYFKNKLISSTKATRLQERLRAYDILNNIPPIMAIYKFTAPSFGPVSQHSCRKTHVDYEEDAWENIICLDLMSS